MLSDLQAYMTVIELLAEDQTNQQGRTERPLLSTTHFMENIIVKGSLLRNW